MSETELVERLERLERSNLWLKGFAFAALLLVTALGTITATQPIPNTITAHRFDVLDDSGKLRVMINTSNNTPGIALFDASGLPLAIMELDRAGSPSILLNNLANNSYANLEVSANGEPSFTLKSIKGQGGTAYMSVDPSGSPNIMLHDPQGFEMVLGSSGTVSAKTGTTEKTSAASIIMFRNDAEHHVMWQGP